MSSCLVFVLGLDGKLLDGVVKWLKKKWKEGRHVASGLACPGFYDEGYLLSAKYAVEKGIADLDFSPTSVVVIVPKIRGWEAVAASLSYCPDIAFFPSNNWKANALADAIAEAIASHAKKPAIIERYMRDYSPEILVPCRNFSSEHLRQHLNVVGTSSAGPSRVHEPAIVEALSSFKKRHQRDGYLVDSQSRQFQLSSCDVSCIRMGLQGYRFGTAVDPRLGFLVTSLVGEEVRVSSNDDIVASEGFWVAPDGAVYEHPV